MRRDLAHVFEVLPVDAAPGDAVVDLGELDLAHGGLDLSAAKAFLIEAGASLNVLRLDDLATEGDLDEFFGGKQVSAAQEQGIDGVGSGFGGLPILRLFLLEQPDFTVFNGLLVLRDFIEGLDHHGLGLDGSPVPPPGIFFVTPVHAEFVVSLGELFERSHDVGGRDFFLAESLDGEGEVGLGLPWQRKPVFGGLGEEVGDGFFVLASDGLVFEKEATAVEVKGDGAGEVVGVFVSVLEDVAVGVVDPAVKLLQGFYGGFEVEALEPEVTETAETGGDIESDVVASAAACKPGPGAVGQLHVRELAHGSCGLRIKPVVVEKDADLAAGGAFIFALHEPWGLGEHDGFEVLVFLERAVESLGAFPEVEDAADFWVGLGDVAG